MSRTQPIVIDSPCVHTMDVKINDVVRPAKGCEDCLKVGSTWVHLRECLSCGHIACCDSSPNRHATRHFRTSHHPIVTSVELGETWVWCYVDESFISP